MNFKHPNYWSAVRHANHYTKWAGCEWQTQKSFHYPRVMVEWFQLNSANSSNEKIEKMANILKKGKHIMEGCKTVEIKYSKLISWDSESRCSHSVNVDVELLSPLETTIRLEKPAGISEKALLFRRYQKVSQCFSAVLSARAVMGSILEPPPMLVDTSANMWIGKAWLPCWPLDSQQVLKPKADVTRSPKQG